MIDPEPRQQVNSPVKTGPKTGPRRRSGLRRLEQILLFTGVFLLLTFAGIKFQKSDSSDAGITAFYQQVEAATLAESSDVQVDNTASDADKSADPKQWALATGSLQSQPPEFELWSDNRIAEYQQSLLQETDPPLGILRIERLNIEVPIYNGTDEFILNRGVGRIKGTARIDGNGNLGIAGHRDGFFRGLKDIKPGDVLELQTLHEVTQYRVGSTVIVDPSDVSVLAPTAARTMTLVTCYPFYFVGHAPKRFIVQAAAEPPVAMN